MPAKKICQHWTPLFCLLQLLLIQLVCPVASIAVMNHAASRGGFLQTNNNKKRKTTVLCPQRALKCASSNKSSMTSSDDERVESTPSIVLFGTHDLRLHNNKALELAAVSHEQILPVFIWEIQQPEWGVQGAAQVILKDALRNLETLLKKHKLPLVCLNTNDAVQELRLLVQQTGAAAVYLNREMTTDSRNMDQRRLRAMKKLGDKVVACQSSLLYDVERVTLVEGFHNGGHWGTLMPFLKACQEQFGEPSRYHDYTAIEQLLDGIQSPSKVPTGVPVNELQMAIMPPNTKWDVPILQCFPMSCEAARDRLDKFFEAGLPRYESERSRADKNMATSKLSAYLRFGILSPNELYWRIKEDTSLSFEKKKTFYRRLFWRDLAYYQLYCFPKMPVKSIREHYEKTEWVSGKEAKRRLQAWKKGMTGYPLVDAGMRELYAMGWMTQSVRMVVASFLVEYLRIDWKEGAKWFHYTLADADVAINSMMWQNAGRSGIDQWNFCPSPENASQDPSGEYTRRWIPELAKLPTKYLHKPWLATDSELRKAGVVLGETYPQRIVENLKSERAKSIESVLTMRKDSQNHNDDKGYDLISLPNGSDTAVFTKKEYRIDRQGVAFGQHEPNKRATGQSRKRKTTGKSRRGRRR